jgi:Na+-transporting NADH:ubiquinone oxidoreductase subunit B
VNIQKQQAMRNVLYALAPLCLAAVYLYGWRFVAVLAVVAAVGLASEWLMAKRYNLKVTESLFVTCTLFALSLPPTIPLWMAAVGIAFGVVFGKMVFGGFGKNVFNPAITARAFVYISFGVPMTARFVQSAAATAWLPGGFGTWVATDSVAAATPLITRSESLLHLFLGTTSGSFGETSALLILMGGAFILIKKTANWKIVASSIGSFLLLQTILWSLGVQVQSASGPQGLPDPLHALLSGSFLLGAFFMITDPVSAGQSTEAGKWVYGALFGLMTVLIRSFSTWTEGVTFAILLANMFGPLFDTMFKSLKAKKKEKAARAAQGGQA